MKIQPNVRKAMLVAALATATATAWATSDSSPAPVTHVAVTATSEPQIRVEEQRLPEDVRIQAQVMEVLVNNPRLAGRIAVESKDAVVTLSGYTITAGQARHAGDDAGRVMGVRYVRNEIHPMLRGSI
jgi:hyperosmotically inducible periplasmic protein